MALVFGIDAGIASVGWAVVAVEGTNGQVIACGARMFDAPETAKERKPTNAVRREKRGMRRVIRRRRERMEDVRALFAAHGLIGSAAADALALGHDPWVLRAEALDRRLSGAELAVALGHIARHRGFRSNSKAERGANAAAESSRMLAAIAVTQERLQGWRTVGEMFARDSAFAACKRNRGGGFVRSVLRDDQEAEVRRIFAAQRRLGSGEANAVLEEAFVPAAFSQRPLQDSDALVGPCPFMLEERRSARRAPSFEMFRLLSRLNAIRLVSDGVERALVPEEVVAASAGFGVQKGLSWTGLRKRLALDKGVRFVGVPVEGEKHDLVARSGHAAEGTSALRAVVVDAAGEEGWAALVGQPEQREAIKRRDAGEPMREIAHIYNVSHSTISRLKS